MHLYFYDEYKNAIISTFGETLRSFNGLVLCFRLTKRMILTMTQDFIIKYMYFIC